MLGRRQDSIRLPFASNHAARLADRPCYNVPMYGPTDRSGSAESNGIRAAFRRHQLVHIYLPLILSLVVVAGLTVALWRSGIGTASAWADGALIVLLVVSLLGGFIALAVLAGLAFAIGRLIDRIPEPAWRLNRLVVRIESGSARAMDYTVRPFLLIQSTWAAIGRARRVLGSIIEPKSAREPMEKM